MPDTPRLALPLLDAGQAQKEVTHNEALLALDRLLHVRLASRSVAAPPTGAAVGTAYLVPGAASGAWSGGAGQIAVREGAGWRLAAPVPGMIAFVADENLFLFYDTGWSDGAWPAAGLRVAGRTVLAGSPATIAAPSGGTVIDTESRLVINALIAALRSQGVIA